MRKGKAVILFILAGLLFMIVYCGDSPTAGNGSQTPNAIYGIIYNPNGSRAVSAKVLIITSDHNPKQIKNKIRTIVDTAITNDTGAFFLNSLPAGYYNILGQGDSGVSYNDSVFIQGDTTADDLSDTLRFSGTLSGVVRLQPGDDSRTVFILVFGTQTWIVPIDSIGNFTLSLAEGTYHARILTTLDDYDPLDTNLTIRSGIVDTLNDTIFLPYTGIPVPKGLTLTYDTLKQIVTLSWNKCDANLVKGYNVYRKHSDSDFVKINIALIPDTVFSDSTLGFSAIYEYKVASVDKSDEQGLKSEGVTVDFKNRIKLATNSAAFGRRLNHSSVAFDNKIWIIAGDGINYERKNDVWSSNDGINWTLVIDSASFPKRTCHSSVVFNNKIWVIGGYDGDEKNDIWSSNDGINWIKETGSAAFSPRYLHGSIVFNNLIWVIGGISGSSNYYTDVWYSSDGISWNKATDSAGFSPREYIKVVVLDNKIWLVGGAHPNSLYNDVWYTTDGTIWKNATNSAKFPERYNHSLAVFDSLLWISGGMGNNSEVFSDVWYSANGIDWVKFNTPLNFTKKRSHTSVFYNNRLWIIGQAYDESRSDVWYLE